MEIFNVIGWTMILLINYKVKGNFFRIKIIIRGVCVYIVITI